METETELAGGVAPPAFNRAIVEERASVVCAASDTSDVINAVNQLRGKS
jgi:hypothetical protein